MVEYKDRIEELEEELRTTKYNKKTQHAIGLLKAKIANLKKKKAGQKKAGSKQGYVIRRSGDATVVLVGFPSVGKSTLLNALTNQESEVGGYDFTTLDAIPGLLNYKGAKIQIFDVPGLVEGAAAGTGRGKEVLSVLRSADLCLILVDINHPEHLEVIKKEIYDSMIRLNQSKPDVRIKKTIKGGIRIGKTVKLNVSDDTLKAILNEMGIANANVLIRTKVTEDQFIDVIEGNRKYVNGVVVLNKIDSMSKGGVGNIAKKLGVDVLVSAEKKQGLNELKEMIFDKLDLIRIYLKQPGKEADMKEPLIVYGGVTVKGVCDKLHRNILNRFKFARVWGKSTKFDGQKLTLKHKLLDEDIVELHLS